MSGLFVALFVVMFAVVAVLLAGVVVMSRGGEANRKYGNKLMVARVSLQALAVALLALLFIVGKSGE